MKIIILKSLLFTTSVSLITSFLIIISNNGPILPDPSHVQIEINNTTIQIKGCECYRVYKQNSFNLSSLCSDEASLEGPGQKVISFSFYKGHPRSMKIYFEGIEENLKVNKKFYPLHFTRIYSDVEKNEDVCNLLCKNRDLFWCDVNQLPGNFKNVEGTIWRIFPLGDPLVSEFHVRDLDGLSSPRELDAVREWENSKFPFHTIRDCPCHKSEIMGGLIDINNTKLDKSLATELLNNLIKEGLRKSPSHKKSSDQKVFVKVFLSNSTYREMWMAHDSFNCLNLTQSMGETHPFPSQRPLQYDGPMRSEKLFFVGQCLRRGCSIFKTNVLPCPEECRPLNGKHWKYC